MKKILIISVIFIAAIFIYVNLSNKGKINPSPGVQANKNETRTNTANTEETTLPEIPDIYNFTSLIIDSKLKPVKLKLPDSLIWNKSLINISASIPRSVRVCDLFLVINSTKKDMFYRAKSGEYVFKNVILNAGRNELEIFYRIHQRRSKSATSIIIRE